MDRAEPTGQYKCLTAHFLGRFFDFEAISSPQIDAIEKNTLMFQILAMLVLPGTVKCLYSFAKYGYYTYRPVIERDAAAINDKCFFLSLSMVLIGFIAVFEWDMLFPDRKDYLNLTPFPVATRTIFFAKTSALAAFLLIFTITINLVPTLLFPPAVLSNNGFAYRTMGRTVPFSQIIRYIAAHGISAFLGNIFLFLSAISLQGMLLALAPARFAPLVSRCARFVSLLLLVCSLFFFWGMTSVDVLIKSGSPIALWYPPIWFIGVYEVLLGSQDAAMWGLAGRALFALALAGLVSLMTYAICYKGFLCRSIESGSGVPHSATSAGTAVRSLLDRWLIYGSENKASFHFVGQTLFRSSRHVLYITTFFVVGLALAAIELTSAVAGRNESSLNRLDNAVLSIPLVLALFLLVGLRVSFAIPVDLDANWLFRLAPIKQIKTSRAGIRKFVIGAIIIPLFVVSGLFYALIWDAGVICLHIGYGLCLSLILMELLFSRFAKIPFTCSYLPGVAQIVVLWPFYVLGFKLLGYAAATLETWLLNDTPRFFYFYGAAAILFGILIRDNSCSGGADIKFEEESEKAPIYLDLKS